MPVADLPPQLQERVVCSITAAVKYQIPANIVLAVAEKEAGKPGQWMRNANGTHDVGPMQFNTAYLRDLAGYGITPDDVAAAGCYAFDLAAWRLRQHIKKDRGDLWTRAANYHSRTPQYNATYRADLLVKSRRWADWLEARFVTVEVTKANALPSMPATPAALQLAPAQTAKVVAMPAQTPVTTVAWNTSGYVPRKIIINGQP
ncbi:MAG: transglycosylase SLT domain-containing protein [Candidatus Accumulibacter phosphatis]|uniref:IncP-type conjugative transfer protein TrbN n=2 Tax=Candidatus Accumulibacter TaxID=327159 RepID=A0A5S4EN85_9PROT|nr:MULTISPECIES: transglycosylase SLT domain-containing protein [Candidatus Accumulibacter]MBO3712755.1 transglycosylase SLT domain-containing protein [Accumulibacter sp.]MCQ1547949.1 transglycosylase SLT domain-containing protein [Candidatus Accumulibacter phosphatis]TMQ76852.1 IncP-type conjugative transfer protein TrbN [Candidatus Accumulibacter phosphatis]